MIDTKDKDIELSKDGDLEKGEVKLTDWKVEPTITDLKEDYTNAKSFHDDQVVKIDNWLDALEITGNSKIKEVKGKSKVQPKLIKKQAEWRYSSLSEPFLSSPDLFQVSPVSWEDRKAANQNALVLNNQFYTKLDRTKFIDNYVRAAVNEGTAIIRTSWSFSQAEVDVMKPVFEYQEMPMNEEIVQQIQQLQQMKVEEPDGFNQLDPATIETLRLYEETQKLVMVQQVGEEESTELKTMVNQPELHICDYKDVIPDPTCEGDMERANFVVYKFESSYAELKASGMYENLDKLKEDNKEGIGKEDFNALALDDSKIDDVEVNSGFTFGDNSRKKFMVYEYWGFWDTEGNGDLTPIVATWVNDTLIRLEENPFPDGKIPFIFVPYLPVKNSLYGEPDGALIEDHQKIVGAVTRGMIDLLALSANSQMAMPKGILDAVNKRRFLAGEAYEYNGAAGMNPSQAIFMHKYPELPNSALQVIQLMNNEAEALTGVKSFSAGGITGANLGDSAAGVRGALDAASKREMGILRRLSSGMTQVGRKIISMNSEFLEEEEIIRITNERFIPVRKDDLAGNFDLKLSISTAEVDNAKAQELAFMLQTMGNNIDPSMSKLILVEIARLRKMPDLARQIETFEPEPDPYQEQMKELEMQRVQAEIQVLQAEAAEKGSKGNINTAKIPVEQARAAKLQSEADNQSLNFMEQQDGTKHGRDMQKEQLRSDSLIKNTNAAKTADLERDITNNIMNALTNMGTKQDGV
jgi:hypothetical protein